MKTTTYILLLPLMLAGWPAFMRATTNNDFSPGKLHSGSLHFIKNVGQVDSSISFYTNTFYGSVLITESGSIAYSLINYQCSSKLWTGCFYESFPKRNSSHTIDGHDETSTAVHYFNGKDDKNWNSDVPTYKSVSIDGIAPGIDLKISAHTNNVEKLFIIKPGFTLPFDLVSLKGVQSIHINGSGELVVVSNQTNTIFSKPVAFQEIEGKNSKVDVRYLIGSENQSYSFSLGEYDPNYPLYIDPLIASTYLGGTGDDINYGPFIEIDEQDYVYLSGFTNSINTFPVTPGSYQQSYAGGPLDCFVAKFSNDLETLIACTFIGGSGFETECTLTLDNNGYVYIGGYTNSTDFPVTSGAFNEENSGEYDIFLAKLTDDLSTLVAATYVGGSSNDGFQENRINLEFGSDNVLYIAAQSQSSDFPVTLGSWDPTFNGVGFLYSGDAVVFKMNSELTEMLAGTYLGGSFDEYRVSLALDSEENVFCACGTYSWNIPLPVGGYNLTYNDSLEIIIFKLSNDLSELMAGTYLGAGGNELSLSLESDEEGSIYVSGYTSSTDFPTTLEAFSQVNNGGNDAFITKLNNDLSSIQSSTYLGGTQPDVGQALTIHPSGNVYITGKTLSEDFPIIPGTYDDTYNGGGPEHGDIFVSQLNSDLSQLKASTFLGGSADDKPFGIAIDSKNNVFIGGLTHSNDFPTSTSCFDSTFNGGLRDVIVSKLNLDIVTGVNNPIEYQRKNIQIVAIPNPFKNKVEFRFPNDWGDPFILLIYDKLGGVVYRGINPSGFHRQNVIWDGCDLQGNLLPSGIYFYTLISESISQFGKLIKSK